MGNHNSTRPPGGLPPLAGGHLLPQKIQFDCKWIPQIGQIPMLVGAAPIVLGTQIKFFGGVPARVVVAAPILGAMMAAGEASAEQTARALAAADALLGLDRQQREPPASAEATPNAE